METIVISSKGIDLIRLGFDSKGSDSLQMDQSDLLYKNLPEIINKNPELDGSVFADVVLANTWYSDINSLVEAALSAGFELLPANGQDTPEEGYLTGRKTLIDERNRYAKRLFVMHSITIVVLAATIALAMDRGLYALLVLNLVCMSGLISGFIAISVKDYQIDQVKIDRFFHEDSG